MLLLWPQRPHEVTNGKVTENQKCKNSHFLKNQFFSFLIISLVTFELHECTIPLIKAKNISFGPYFVNFLAKINIL